MWWPLFGFWPRLRLLDQDLLCDILDIVDCCDYLSAALLWLRGFLLLVWLLWELFCFAINFSINYKFYWLRLQNFRSRYLRWILFSSFSALSTASWHILITPLWNLNPSCVFIDMLRYLIGAAGASPAPSMHSMNLRALTSCNFAFRKCKTLKSISSWNSCKIWQSCSTQK